MDFVAILKLIEDGQAVVDSKPPGNNPEAVRQLLTIADKLRVASNNNGVIEQKCSSMMEFASIAYAPHMRQSHPREDAHQVVASDLYTMRIHILQIQHFQPSRSECRTPEETR